MQKLTNWLMDNRTKIGYTVGILNLLAGVSNILYGNYGLATFSFLIGAWIIYDTKTSK